MKLVKKSIIAFLLFFSVGTTLGQQLQFSGDVGYGKGSFDKIKTTLPFTNPDFKNIQLTAGLSYIIAKGHISFNAGCRGNSLLYYNTNIWTLKVPLGIDLNLGRKVQYFVGTGIQPGVVLYNAMKQYDSRSYDCRTVIMDVFGHTGVKYYFKERWGLFADVQLNFLPTVMVRHNIYHQIYTNEISRYNDYRMFSSSFNLGFTYSFPLKATNKT